MQKQTVKRDFRVIIELFNNISYNKTN